MKTLLSGIVLILSLTGCGGPANEGQSAPPIQTPAPTCTCEWQPSVWSSCAPNGTQTRTILGTTESVQGCCVEAAAQGMTPPLKQACTYTPPPPVGCQAPTPNTCEVPNKPTMCCPSAAQYYCARLNVCLTGTDLMALYNTCGETPYFCTLPTTPILGG